VTPRYRLFRRLALAGVVLAFGVVVLGAWVRLSNAGLGCPDWPGCYGHLTADDAAQNADAINQAFPERPFTYHKAIKEMVHRYFAGGLVLVVVTLAGLAIANRRDPQQPLGLPIALVGLVFLQALLGMWTVTLLLKPLIVVLHLLGGLTTLALLAWLALAPAPSWSSPAERGRNQVGALKTLAATGLIVLGLQIALGGWVSSNYAALACPDFPTCQATLWPEMDFQDAFVLWRGLGIDYEGGVLDHPARVAIHFTHRIGAMVAAFALGFVAWRAIRMSGTRKVRGAGIVLGVVLLVQLVLGPAMVLTRLPLALATAHNGVAALLLLATVALLRAVTPAAVRDRGR
jgi:cytochrome c oxidase assembly protein subunit 15